MTNLTRRWGLPYETDHAHHYIMPGQGFTVVGRCKICGHEREFDNSIPDTRMGGTPTTAMNASRAAAQEAANRNRNQRPIVLSQARAKDWVIPKQREREL